MNEIIERALADYSWGTEDYSMQARWACRRAVKETLRVVAGWGSKQILALAATLED